MQSFPSLPRVCSSSETPSTSRASRRSSPDSSLVVSQTPVRLCFHLLPNPDTQPFTHSQSSTRQPRPSRQRRPRPKLPPAFLCTARTASPDWSSYLPASRHCFQLSAYAVSLPWTFHLPLPTFGLFRFSLASIAIKHRSSFTFCSAPFPYPEFFSSSSSSFASQSPSRYSTYYPSPCLGSFLFLFRLGLRRSPQEAVVRCIPYPL